MIYLVANIIGAIPWLFFFKRKDLRKKMLIMSVLAMPLAFFDLLYVPSYWQPVTLFNIPIGIEGFIFSFEIGGVAAAISQVVTKQTSVKIKSSQNPLSLIHLIAVLPIAFLFNSLVPLNITVGMHIGLLCGIFLLILFRSDLLKSILISAFGLFTVYFISLLIWGNLYPETVEWFTFENLPKFFIFNVPVYELTFAFLFGAYWGSLYESLFGYRFTSRPQEI